MLAEPSYDELFDFELPIQIGESQHPAPTLFVRKAARARARAKLPVAAVASAVAATDSQGLPQEHSTALGKA
eukprot:6191651-Pleurochrysis_carterae.AAC.2